MLPRWMIVLLLGAGSLGGCFAPPAPDFDSPEPMARIDAALEVAAEAEASDDLSSAPKLIEMLDSDDPLARLVAIRTLERLTGETRGYRHNDPELQRRLATDRWIEWWARHSGYDGPERSQTPSAGGASASLPAGQPGVS